MKRKTIVSIAAAVVLLFAQGCGGTGQESEQGNNTQQSENVDQNISQQPSGGASGSEKTRYICSVTAENDSRFSDSYTTQRIDDTKWPQRYTYTMLTVKNIEEAFTQARANDPTVSGPMVLPPEAEWKSYSSSEKVLYLVNKARCDRGLKPFEGIDSAIEQVAQSYADYLAAHPDAYRANPHEADGRTPFERMQQDAGVEVGSNADFFSYGENIASFGIGTSLPEYPEVYESEARAVYGWLYEDKAQNYGHRKFLLAKRLVENSGLSGAEGLVGVGKARRHFTDEKGNHWTEDIVVLDGFDPRSSWDDNLAHTQRVPLYR